MFSKIIPKIRHKLAFRLTLWYFIISATSLVGTLVVIYLLIANSIQKHIDHGLLGDLYEVSATLALAGPDATRKALQIEAESDGIDKIFLRLLDSRGRVIATSDMKYWAKVAINKGLLQQINSEETYLFETQSISSDSYVTRIIYGKVGSGKILQIGVSVQQEKRFLNTLSATIVPLIVFMVLFSAVIGWFMANRALSGVGEVTKTALDIAKGAFEQRVHVKAKGDEIEQLANTFNLMLDRISELMKGLREMTDNIAHDLRTPLTRIRVAAEAELRKEKRPDRSDGLAAGIIEECDNLLQMIDTMLLISKEEAGIPESEKKRADISRLIKDAFGLFLPIAEEKGIQFESQTPGDVAVIGDFRGLQRMIVNLVENAIKYTPAGGKVLISLGIENENIKIVVSDTGIGIDAKDLPHIFKRLYRCDRSRSQQGFGLGLSLALAVAHAHRGDITVTSEPGQGSTFTVILPR
ncbi:MAG: HAMP domain-containing protein [Syntrophaceae bacterium]|nr:HAMP domain-containing protein [Syntrophaceae bacterium]